MEKEKAEMPGSSFTDPRSLQKQIMDLKFRITRLEKKLGVVKER